MKRSIKEPMLTCSGSFSRCLNVKMFVMLLPRILKSFQHFFILRISRPKKKMIRTSFFAERSAVKSSIKPVRERSLLTLYNRFFVLKMNNLCGSTLS
jgi:hypothetical protein